MKKRILSIIMAICLLLSCVPITVFAADEVGNEYAFLDVLNKGGTQKLDKDYVCALGHNIGKDITIDLNGHVIYYTGADHRLSIGRENSNKRLTIKDSNPNKEHTGQFAGLPNGGVIVALDGSSGGGGGVYIDKTSTFNMEGGTIYNCNANGYGGAIYVLGTFNMSGGTISNAKASYNGGAVCVTDSGIFNMSGGTISNCKASKSGGAVYVKASGVFTMSGGTIEDCSADESGGAVYNEKSFTMSGGTISKCSAVQYGGAVSNISSFTMTNGNIKNCNASIGGGVFTGGTFTMNGGTIDNCKADQYGGGVYNLKASTSAGKFTLDGGIIKNCNADKGAGVANISSNDNVADFTMNSGTIDNCNATLTGGGLYNEKTAVSTMNGGIIKNCSSHTGGGVTINGSGKIDESTGEFIPSSDTINTKCKFNMNGGTIENCKATTDDGLKGYGGGILAFYATFTMNNGTIKNCSAPHKESASVCLFTNATMYADGGSVYGQSLVFGQVNDTVSRIRNTASTKYTKFYGLVENQGNISGGVFYGGIKNTKNKNGVYGNVTNPYSIVTFDSDGGSSVPKQWFVNTSGATVLKPTDPTKENYQFMDWYNGNNKYDFTNTVSNSTKTLTLKAKWVKTGVETEAELRTALDEGITSIKLIGDFQLTSMLDLTDKVITLDLNGHVLSAKMPFTDFIYLYASKSPSGYGAQLILKDSNPTATHTDSTLPLGGVLDCQIILNVEDGCAYNSTLKAEGGTVIRMVRLNHQNTAIMRSSDSTTTTSFTLSVGGSGGHIFDGIYYGNLQENLVLGKTVTFKDGDSVYAKEVVSNKAAVKPVDPEKDGFVFAGWYNGSTKYNFSQKVTSNITLTAKWLNEVNSEATLRAAINEGLTTIKLMADINLSSALDLSNKNITIDLNGYVISGADISVNTGKGSASLTLKDSRPTATHTDSTLPLGGVVTSKISMNKSGGSYNNCVLYANGGTVTSEFNTNTNNVSIKCTSNTPTAFTGKISGYAHLYGGIYYGTITSTVKIEGKKITFKNGNNTYAYEVVYIGNITVAPTTPPIKEGYDGFNGWYNGDTKYTFGSSLSEDITLTAKFNPITYGIVYFLNDGTVNPENPVHYTVESENITLNNPKKTGYTFIGWSGTDFSGIKMTVTIPKGSTGLRMYSANYTQNTYTVKFNTNGGSNISDKTGVVWTGKVLTGINNPTKAGYEFTGWKCGNKTVNANTVYSELASDDSVTSVTLVAQWKDIEKPVITGLENGKTYCDDVEFTVSDNDGIASVMAGSTVLTATNGKYTLAKGKGTVTVVATDKAGNKTSITVTVNNGHTYGAWQSNGDGTHTRYCTITGCNGEDKQNCSGGQASYFKKAVCEDCHTKYGNLMTDTTAPTGEISIGANKWRDFLNTITFGIFFKNTQSVTITASDDSYDHAGYTDDKAVKVEYYLYSSDTALTKAELAGKEFTAYNGAFNINPDNKYVVYAKLTDHAGNVTYTSSNGIVLDATSPVITGVENNKVYCEEQTVTVTEEYIESVKVNGADVTLDANNQFTLQANGEQTLVVTDKAGNETSVTVTVNNGHTYEWQSENSQYWQKCKYCGYETAKKDIPSLTIDAPDTVCRTQDCEASVTLPDGITDAVLTFEFIGLGGAIDTTVEDGKLYGVVTAEGYPNVEYSFNLVVYATTNDGFPFTVSKTVQIQEEHAGGVATCTELAICDTCGEPYGEVDSTNHNLEKISANPASVTETGNKEYWHCLDCGKFFADENGTNEITLDDTVIAKLPPEIIEGNGQSITAGEKKELTFRSNALFGDFIRFELDGETVDSMNYTVKEGSTIVTLNSDYVATLSPGEHTIGIVSVSGTATATFTVNAKTVVDNGKKSPQTGNDINTAILLTLILSCGGVIIVTGAYGKKKKYSEK